MKEWEEESKRKRGGGPEELTPAHKKTETHTHARAPLLPELTVVETQSEKFRLLIAHTYKHISRA